MILPLFTSVILMYLLKYRKLRFKQIILYGVLGFFIIYIVYALGIINAYLIYFYHYSTLSSLSIIYYRLDK